MATNTKPFKVGDPIAFEHMGMEKSGEIVELLSDGKVRIKDSRGLAYRYLVENVSHAGSPIVKNPQVALTGSATTQSANVGQTITTEIQTKPTEPMAKKKEAAPVAVSTADAATIQKIKALTCKKHQRLFLLLDAGCSKEEAMAHGGANAGEVSNARKMYAESAEKAAAAKALLA